MFRFVYPLHSDGYGLYGDMSSRVIGARVHREVAARGATNARPLCTFSSPLHAVCACTGGLCIACVFLRAGLSKTWIVYV